MAISFICFLHVFFHIGKRNRNTGTNTDISMMIWPGIVWKRPQNVNMVYYLTMCVTY